MSEDLEWTQAVGEAFLAQQEDVLASIQVLRDRAYAAGNLRTDERVVVQRELQVIRIETVRREKYVPVYDSRYVYGSWWHRRPPVYWDGFGVSVSFAEAYWTLVQRQVGIFSDFYWRNRYVVIHHHHYHDLTAVIVVTAVIIIDRALVMVTAGAMIRVIVVTSTTVIVTCTKSAKI